MVKQQHHQQYFTTGEQDLGDIPMNGRSIPYAFWSNAGHFSLVPLKQHGSNSRFTTLLCVALLTVIAFLPRQVQGQDDIEKEQHRLAVASRPYADKVVLKWFPSRRSIWEEGLSQGYDIYRRTLYTEGQWVKEAEEIRLNDTPILPASDEEWEAAVDSTENAHGAFFALGRDSLPEEAPADIHEAWQRGKSENMVFAMALLMADMHMIVAQLTGMTFQDNDVTAGEKYQYIVRLHGAAPGTAAEGRRYVDTDKKYRIPQPYGLDVKFNDKNAQLEWNNVYTNFSFAYYNIYRSKRKNRGYEKVNKLPFAGLKSQEMRDDRMAYYTDTVPEIGTTYYYKIEGVSSFGEASEFSERISGAAYLLLKYAPVFTRDTADKRGHVHLAWEMDSVDRESVKEYEILRSGHPNGTFESMTEEPLDGDEVTFTDEEPLRSGYYKICASGHAGDRKCTAPRGILLEDSIPPAPPEWIEAETDTTGKIHLSWKANKETDLEGYRLFRADHEEDEYRRVYPGSLTDTTYTDTVSLKIATSWVWYKIVAFDNHYNTSEYSEVLKVPRPDINPPTKPVFNDFTSTDKGVELKWYNSSSHDLSRTALLRKGPLDVNYRPLKIFNVEDSVSQWTDTTTKDRKFYHYTLVAEDINGLRSDSAVAIRVKQKPRMGKGEIKEVRTIVSREHKKIKLSWDYKGDKPEHFIIYRAGEEEPLKFYAKVAGREREYYDDRLTPDTQYTYVMVARLPGGAVTKRSEEAEVKF